MRENAAMVWLVFALIVTGLIVGGLGRLLIPGRDPIGLGMTILVGIAGSFLGGLVGRLAFGFRYRYSYLAGLVLSVLFAAAIVYLLSRSKRAS